MSQVPGLGHVTFYRHPCRYPTLFHSPLVGVDKETLATSTLRWREVRRRNGKLGNLFSRSRSRSLGSRSRSRSLMCLARYSTWLVALALLDVLGSLLLLGSLFLHLLMYLARYSCLARSSCT